MQLNVLSDFEHVIEASRLVEGGRLDEQTCLYIS